MVQYIELFDKYVRWRILGHFLSHPNTSYYIKEVARMLGVSSGSVSTAVRFLSEGGLLIREEQDRVHPYRLNLDHPLATPLRKAYGLLVVLSSRPVERLLDADSNVVSIALYGSYADGSYDEWSDIDLLVVTSTKRDELLEAVADLERDLGRPVNVSLFKLSEWRELLGRGDVFYKKVVQNHVMLYGSGLA
jgi:predicted nucleotidyltransferase